MNDRDEDAFEQHFEKALRTYAAAALEPIDPDVVARRTMQTRRSVPWLAAIAVAGIATAAGLALADVAIDVGRRAGQSSPGASATQPPAGEPKPSLVETLPEDVYDLAYDAKRDIIWFAELFPGKQDYLVHLDPTSGRLERFELPDSGHNGFLSEVRVDATGAIWINQDGYRLLRFDPATGVIASHVFPVHVPGAINGGSDGTWISALTTEGDGAWVARHNVPNLIHLDASATPTATVSLSRENAGSVGLVVRQNEIVLLREGREATTEMPAVVWGVAFLNRKGRETGFSQVQATSLQEFGDRLLTAGWGDQVGALAWVDRTGANPIGALAGSEFLAGSAALAPGGDIIAFERGGSPPSTALVRISGSSVTRRLQFLGQPYDTCNVRPPPLPGQPDPCASGPQIAYVSLTVNDLVTDSRGVTWYVEQGTHRLMRVNL
jgi:hypothetical protein